MRILWLINIVLPKVANALEIDLKGYGGGWLTGLSELLINKENVKLAIIMPKKDVCDIESGYVGNLIYYFYPEKYNSDYSKDTSIYLKRIINDFKPDIVHAFGTEYPRTFSLFEVVDPNKCLISLTGIVSRIAEYYYGNIGAKYTRKSLLRRAIWGIVPFQILSKEKEEFIVRGKYEIKAIEASKHVTGRTTWDKSFSYQVNQNINYYHCGEILRPEFYTGKWSFNSCEKKRIFINNGGYPIKGLHFAIKALSIILAKHLDSHLYVAGSNIFEHENKLKKFVLQNMYDYPRYITDLIKKYNVAEHVHFLGQLSPEEMKREFLKANVFVLPSVIENSPNSLGEAMMLGVPCVAANVGGVSDLCIDKREGYLYQYDNYHMLAYYVCEIFENEANNDMTTAAINHARKSYSREKNLNDLLGIYRTIMKSIEY